MSTANDLVDFEAQVTLTRVELNELLICIERAGWNSLDDTMPATTARQALWDKLFDAGQDALERVQT